MHKSSEVSILQARMGMYREQVARLMKGQLKVSKSNEQMPDKHASEKRGEVGHSCLLFSKARQWYLYGFEPMGTGCTLCARVSRKGKKETEASEVQVDSVTNRAMLYDNKSGVQIEVNEYIGLLCNGGCDIEKTAI